MRVGRPILRSLGRFPALCAIALAAAIAGCGSPVASFHPANVFILKKERDAKTLIPGEQKGEIADTLAALFGTPDEPHVPKLADVEMAGILDERLLDIAAGPVKVDESGRPLGLYREHCAHCHGITGDGRGPTAAFLNPYPRDYRMGLFKFKSTPVGARPTHADLKKVLVNGIPGTAMPSFRLLEERQIEALIQYVRYLSIRGEVERELILQAVDLDTEGGDRLVDLDALGNTATSEALDGQLAAIKDTVATVAGRWQEAEGQVLQVEERPAENDKAAAIARGRELFYGKIANCFSCHGDSALGDGQTNLYDDWTKEIEPTNPNPEVLAGFLKVGALEPRFLRPRNLREGIYRGGRRPLDIYWRIRNGITGAEMPAAPMKTASDPADKKGLTEEDVWCLVEYVRHMPYEPASMPQHSLENLGFTR